MPPSSRTRRLIAPAIVIVLPAAAPAPPARTITATLIGRAADAGGTGLPGVAGRARSATQPGGDRAAITGIEGNHRVSLLPPAGDYPVVVDPPGLARTGLGPIELRAGRTTVADVTLRTTAETTRACRTPTGSPSRPRT